MTGAKYPKHEGKTCYGWDVSQAALADLRQNAGLDLSYLINAYQAFPDKNNFFLKNNFFEKLAGTDVLRQQIIDGKSAEEIKATWQTDLEDFKKIRQQYLRY